MEIILSNKLHHISLRKFSVTAQAHKRSPLTQCAVSRSPLVLIQCLTVNMRNLLTIIKEAVDSIFLWLADTPFIKSRNCGPT